MQHDIVFSFRLSAKADIDILKYLEYTVTINYSRSSRKRPPRELEKVVVTRAGRLRECDLVRDQ